MLETLHKVRQEGFAPSAVDAAVNVTEFALRENNTGRLPKGLALMFRAMKAWVYDRDPYECAPLGPHTDCSHTASWIDRCAHVCTHFFQLAGAVLLPQYAALAKNLGPWYPVNHCVSLPCASVLLPSGVAATCSVLRWEAPLAHFKERLVAGEDVFGDLLDKYLLNNNHRVTVVTLPDSSLAKQVRALARSLRCPGLVQSQQAQPVISVIVIHVVSLME